MVSSLWHTTQINKMKNVKDVKGIFETLSTQL